MLIRVLLLGEIGEPKLALRSLLEAQGILLTEFPDGRNIFQYLVTETFDLVIADLEALPGPPEESLAVIRGLHQAPEVLVLSEADDSRLSARLRAAGASAVLTPATAAHGLEQTLAALVKRRREAVTETSDPRQEIGVSSLRSFAAKSPAMQELLALARKVATADTSLLILGETGTGKEWLARAIHSESSRRSGPFIAVNPSAFPEQLLESELFGHEKGAFTGALGARRGAFELAHGGTLFLDEIGDMPIHLQIKLLRVLQEREIKRLGSERPIAVNVRIMAATNQDLDAEIERGDFRSDLYFRLGVVRLTVPPLRNRKEDIPDLVHTYLELYRKRFGRGNLRGASAEAMQALERYRWPGNVREIINVIERGVLLCEGEALSIDELPEELARGTTPLGRGGGRLDLTSLMEHPLPEAREAVLAAFESSYLSRLLDETHGNLADTASRAGIDPRTLYNKMKSYGLHKEDFQGTGGSETRSDEARHDREKAGVS